MGSVENAFTLKYGSTTLFFFPYISEVCITINIDAEEGSLCLEASGNKVCGSYFGFSEHGGFMEGYTFEIRNVGDRTILKVR